MAARHQRVTTAHGTETEPHWAAHVRGLDRAFGGDRVLRGLDLDLAPGEFTALLGRSGSGKSTLLRVLAGLDGDYDGEAAADGAVAVAFQEPRLLPWKRVWANIVLGVATDAPREAATAALAEVGLAERADAWPLTLSGGQAQRVSLARALIREPRLLLLDEPFGALDALTRATMHDLVLKLWQRHRPAVLIVTHDVDEALLLADRALVLTDGRISHDIDVDLERPRRRQDPRAAELRAELLTALGVAPAAP
ncbi:sulfonate ABC transporter ATP-binding protein [Nocardiopsis gilva YIM 90087]|uniref:Sulfonate ABC transporter ATP-binding protein n=1 Tax=Nocardiopsis gilva YIM 90087 TaxID=1235441 RepID=A0A223S3W3_9ACTN|nr:ABC transporter ATP-binding protein [Nocardiopsis gilva]ASU82820.1 sulfonate ABC transporter ATP-binding protein [Nocardiopsis gilva YIM 90087]